MARQGALNKGLSILVIFLLVIVVLLSNKAYTQQLQEISDEYEIQNDSQWDAEEFEGFNVENLIQEDSSRTDQSNTPSDLPPKTSVQQQTLYRITQAFPKVPLYLDFVAGGFLLVYFVYVFIGAGQNEKRAFKFVNKFMGAESELGRNFWAIGQGEKLNDKGQKSTEYMKVLKESNSTFRLYFTGRRYCIGMLATLDLRPRQDLIQVGLQALLQFHDTLDIDIYMLQKSMPKICLCITNPKFKSKLQNKYKDLKQYSRPLNFQHNSKIDLPPPDELVVLGEHSQIFEDLIQGPVMDRAFGQKQFEVVKPYFRYLLITNENDDKYNDLIRVSMKIPQENNWDSLSPLLEIVPLIIDMVGSYQVNVDIQKKLQQNREKAKTEEEMDEERSKKEDLIQKSRDRKIAAEKAKMAKMSAETREKYEAKLSKQQQKKNKKIVRMA